MKTMAITSPDERWVDLDKYIDSPGHTDNTR